MRPATSRPRAPFLARPSAYWWNKMRNVVVPPPGDVARGDAPLRQGIPLALRSLSLQSICPGRRPRKADNSIPPPDEVRHSSLRAHEEQLFALRSMLPT